MNRGSQGKRSSGQNFRITGKHGDRALFRHDFGGLDRVVVLSAFHRDPAVENGSRGKLFFLSASDVRSRFMSGNGISRLLVLGTSQYLGCRLFHFDPVILSDRPDLEYRRYRPIFQKTNRIQRIAAGLGTTGGRNRIRRLSPVRLRSRDRGHRLLNELFSRLHPSILHGQLAPHAPRNAKIPDSGLPKTARRGILRWMVVV